MHCLQVTINNIHIRYEDPEIAGGKPLVIGLIIDRITAQSTNENWVGQFKIMPMYLYLLQCPFRSLILVLEMTRVTKLWISLI